MKLVYIIINMTSFILCPECKMCIGEISEFVQLVKQGYYTSTITKKDAEIKSDKLKICPNVSKPIGFILDAVGCTNICCRMHILGETDFENIYK